MTKQSRLDPESHAPLQQLLQMLPGGLHAISGIVQRRAAARELFEALPAITSENVDVTSYQVPTVQKGAHVEARVYRPLKSDRILPALLFIHGGGMILGDLDGEESKCIDFCESLGITVVSIDYRKAPEHPYPAATEDCFSGLTWLAENAEKLQIDKENLGIYGGSAGGGLAIATALLTRDRQGPELKYMMPIYPMIDDRNQHNSTFEVTDVGVWDRAANIEAWQWYLNGKPADQYAAPIRAGDLSGLPQAFVDVGDVDMFRDESVEFASRLMQAGVETELHVYPGAYHASEVIAPDAPLSKAIIAARMTALKRFIAE